MEMHRPYCRICCVCFWFVFAFGADQPILTDSVFCRQTARWVALLYLVLRLLDTIKDDMTIPDEVKQPILRIHITVTPGWTFNRSDRTKKTDNSL